jgi:hypothetical protein
MKSAVAFVLYSCIQAAAVVLIIAGCGKVWAAATREDSDEPEMPALRQIGLRHWRPTTLVLGLAETSVATMVLVGFERVLTSVAMGTLGVCFVYVQLRLRRGGIAGDCGCLPAGSHAAMRRLPAFALAGLVLMGGTFGVLLFTLFPPEAIPVRLASLGVGVSSTVGLIALLRRPRGVVAPGWPGRGHRILNAVKEHPAFAVMAGALGVDPKPYRRRRVNGQHEFWFRASADRPAVVVFRVTQVHGGRLTIHGEVKTNDVAS